MDLNSLIKNMKLNEKIRIIRTSKELKRELVAEKLGIDVVNYGKLERGETKITIEKLEKIAEILDVSVQEIFDFDENTNTVNKKDNISNYNNIQLNDINELLKTNLELQNILLKEIKNINEKWKQLYKESKLNNYKSNK